MTIEEPTNSSHAWLINATNEPVDIYVNYADEPTITDVKRLAVGPTFTVQGKDSTPYGVYTLSARPKSSPGAPVLAAASVVFEAGRSFSAVLRTTRRGAAEIAVYENTFVPSAAARMTVCHDASAATLEWHIVPIGQDPPADPRSGSLSSGQWQAANDVVQNDYRFEVVDVDGELVAVHPDLELEHEKNRTLYVVGDLAPTTDPGVLRRHVLEQEFQIAAGPALPDEVTSPAEPLWRSDQNEPLEFSCEPVEVWETNATSTQVAAVDADGVVTNLSVRAVDPPTDGISIPDHGVQPATAIGEKALATVEVLGDVPPGEYDVTIVANDGSLGDHATCDLPVLVKAITVDRLGDVVTHYQDVGQIGDYLADTLRTRLDTTQQHLDDGATVRACQDLQDVLDQMQTASGKSITVAAHEHLERETKALRSGLGCG